MFIHWLDNTSKKCPYVFCIASGLLIGVSSVPLNLYFLSFIAFIPLLYVINNSPKVLLKLILAFFIWHLFSLQSIFILPLGFLNQIISLGFFTLFSFLMTIPFLLYMWTSKKTSHIIIHLFCLPVYWVAYEYLFNKLEFSLGFLKLGNTLSQSPSLIQFYSFTGQSGGSFLIVFINMLLYHFITEKNSIIRKKLTRIAVSTALLIISLNSISFYTTNKGNKETVKVALIQPSFDPYQKTSSQLLQRQIQELVDLTLSIKNQQVDLVVWHEAALKGQIILDDIENDPYVKIIKELSLRVKAPILTGLLGYRLYHEKNSGSPVVRPTGEGRFYDVYNTAALISYNQPVQIQFKTMLVPFIERVPFIDKLSFLEKYHFNFGDQLPSYARSNETNVFEYKTMRIAPIICSELLYAEYAREFIAKGANIVAVISNDAWIGKNFGYLQLAHFNVPLAITEGKSIVRASNAGSCIFINPSGKILEMTKYGEKKAIVKEIELNEQKTFYVKYGDVLAIICLLLSITLIVITGFHSKNNE